MSERVEVRIADCRLRIQPGTHSVEMLHEAARKADLSLDRGMGRRSGDSRLTLRHLEPRKMVQALFTLSLTLENLRTDLKGMTQELAAEVEALRREIDELRSKSGGKS
ncbi:MAG: hypothetical protein CMH55_05800 [Myxococcales bacterium]|nr:hypothetical protein [Myxococcales bacterium]